MARQIFTASSVNRYIKSLIARDYALRDISVKGEVSNCLYHSSGHIYFTLKDAGGALSCVMFAGNRSGLRFEMTDGMSVIVHGYIGVYERSGRYQLYAEDITHDGVGALYEAFDAMKKKLLEQGLFDGKHKKKIPAYPKRLGIVTAKTGAAIRDIINVSTRRDPWIQIIFCPAQVQGDGAARSIVRAIHAIEEYGADVMIVGRGGGSIEDLWAFNEEIVARAVYDCTVPIISAVGHETDTTIIDYAADLRAPTPSAAAELAVPDMRQVAADIRNYRNTLDSRIADNISARLEQLAGYEKALSRLDPKQKALDQRQRLADIQMRMDVIIKGRLESARTKTALYAGELSGLSPLKQFMRGYAYVTDADGHGISHIAQAAEGSELIIEVTDGDISARVTDTRPAARFAADTDETDAAEVIYGKDENAGDSI